MVLKFGLAGMLYYLALYSGGLGRIVQEGAPLGSLGTTTQAQTQTFTKPIAHIVSKSSLVIHSCLAPGHAAKTCTNTGLPARFGPYNPAQMR